MKRVLIGLMVLILALFFTSGAFAQNAIPKTVCLNTPATAETFHLIFKNQGNVRTSAGNKKMYAVHGNVHAAAVYSFPVTGTAYLQNAPSTIVHMNLTGTTQIGPELFTFMYEIFWPFDDTINPVAVVFERANADVNGGNIGNVMNLVDCVTDAIPFDAENQKSFLEELEKLK